MVLRYGESVRENEVRAILANPLETYPRPFGRLFGKGKGAARQNNDAIPINKFDHEGIYRFRARVKRSSKVVVKPDPQWSSLREFKVLHQLTIGGLH